MQRFRSTHILQDPTTKHASTTRHSRTKAFAVRSTDARNNMGRNSRNLQKPQVHDDQLGGRRFRTPRHIRQGRTSLPRCNTERGNHRQPDHEDITHQQECMRHHHRRLNPRKTRHFEVRRHRSRGRSGPIQHSNIYTHDTRTQMVCTSRQHPHHGNLAYSGLHNSSSSTATQHQQQLHRPRDNVDNSTGRSGYRFTKQT